MTAVSTSIRAYHEIASERGLMCDRLRALYSLQGPLTDREASRHLGWHPSEVSARRNDLEDIVMFGLKKDTITGKSGRVHGLKTLV